MDKKSTLITTLVGIVLIIFALIIINPLYEVNAGYTGVLLRFGAVKSANLTPGLHFAMPVSESIVQISNQPQTFNSNETASTHDLQNVTSSVAVTFQINPDNVNEFYNKFGTFNNLIQNVIVPSVSNDVKAVTAQYNAEELITKRDEVDSQIQTLIAASLKPYHITLDAINVTNFAFSSAYSEAIEHKQVAQQQALQANYVLQQVQISAQQQVVKAKASADAAVETANGEAKSLLITAAAQAKANDLVAQSLTPVLLQQKAISQWNGTLPAYISSGAVMPFIGSVAGAASK